MIKNIIFDVGNVLIGYRWKSMLIEDFGVNEEDAERIGHEVFSDELWSKFDRGLLSVEEVAYEYGIKYPMDESIIKRFIFEGELMRVNRPKVWKNAAFLKNKGYRIYVLSNYSEYLFMRHTDCIPFINDLDGRVVSYEIKKLKPEPEIYNYLVNKYDLKPEECIFLDDVKENTDAAERLGIRSYTIESEEYLVKLLTNFCEAEYGMI